MRFDSIDYMPRFDICENRRKRSSVTHNQWILMDNVKTGNCKRGGKSSHEDSLILFKKKKNDEDVGNWRDDNNNSLYS